MTITCQRLVRRPFHRKKEKNKLELRYQEPEWIFVAISAPLIVLGIISLQWIYIKVKTQKVA